MMRNEKIFTEHDTAVARILAKTLELAKATGTELAKVTVSDQNTKGASDIFVRDLEGRVFQACVNAKLPDGRQFVDFNTYRIGDNDYTEWCVETPDSYISTLDREIQALTASRQNEEPVSPRI